MDIKVRNLSIAYGKHTVVKDFDCDIREGEILTIIGPNGSGKSTILKAVTGLLPYQKGTVHLYGKDLKEWKSKEVSQKIAVLPQIHQAPGDFTVEELISYGRMPHQSWFRTDSDDDREIVRWAMVTTGVERFAKRKIHQLSGGELQRVWLACTLAQKPRILFLDEPTTYLDIAHQLEIMELVRELCEKEGIGIVMVLHDLGQALDISNRIIVIQDGKKYSEGYAEDVINCQMLWDVYAVNGDLVSVDSRPRPLISYRFGQVLKEARQFACSQTGANVSGEIIQSIESDE
ncbi:MAG: ABC transporter ATP-binding protein [Eubacteriales bacterium]|nr:ABC transporter ATP-binding protein [Eubacteriales bacterium]